MVQLQRKAERVSQGFAPDREIPHRLAINPRHGRERLPAGLGQLRQDKLGEAAIGGKAAVAEPQHGDRNPVHLVESGEEPRRR